MKRDRLTITLDLELVAAIDSLIDKERLRNRSQTIEYLLKEGLGLHLIEQAFLFFEADYDQTQLEAILVLCHQLQVREIFCVIASQAQNLAQAILAVITTHSPEVIVQQLPADFGSGGALLLKKDLLQQPFLLFWPGTDLFLPTNVVKAYLFHRQSQAITTTLLRSKTALEYQFSGVAIAQPELLHYIPAGVTSLSETVFPQLVKEAKLKGYLFS